MLPGEREMAAATPSSVSSARRSARPTLSSDCVEYEAAHFVNGVVVVARYL